MVSFARHHMPELTTYTKPLTELQAAKLRTLMQQKGFEFVTKPYCLYAGSGEKVSVAVYEKGPKVVIQGKGTEDFIRFTLEPEVLGEAELGYEEEKAPDMYSPHIGVDESGKGDFFGPLVIAGVYVDADIARQLKALGAMDSKKIGGDAKIEKVAAAIRTIRGLKAEVILISPEKYNQLYVQFRNLNRLLAWGHARVIENLLELVPGCPRALSDQFANPRVLQSALQQRGKSIVLEQKTKAESDLAVAAASILARERFVRWLSENSDRVGVNLAKGVSSIVKKNAVNLIKSHGPEILPSVAKMHFKTAQEVLAQANY